MLQNSGPHHSSYFESAMTLFSEPVRGGRMCIMIRVVHCLLTFSDQKFIPENKKCTKLLFMRSRSVKDQKRTGLPRNMVGFSDSANSTYAQSVVAT